MNKYLLSVAAKYVLLAIAFMITSCSTTPTQSQKNATITKSSLSEDDLKIYREAMSQITAGTPNKAKQSLQKLTQSNPGHFGSWINLATVSYNEKNLQEASMALEHAKAIDPNPAEIYNLAGLINVEKGEYNDAEKNYTAAITRNNNYAAAHYNLALLYDLYYQDMENAVIHYEKYLSLSDNTDKATSSWVNELKQKMKRKGAQR